MFVNRAIPVANGTEGVLSTLVANGSERVKLMHFCDCLLHCKLCVCVCVCMWFVHLSCMIWWLSCGNSNRTGLPTL